MFRTSVLSWVMLPVYVWQGIRLRMQIERLLPAYLPCEGIVEGRGEPIRLLVIGDSTVASVGVDELDGTFAVNLALALNERSGRSVKWRAAGANSASSGDLERFVLPHIEERDFTHIVVSVGTNDMKNFHLVRRFKREFGALVYALKTRFPHAVTLWLPINDMRKFPALPKSLGVVLNARGALINSKGRQLCNERGIAVAEPYHITSSDGFARDGFHPNAAGYQLWAQHIAPQLLAVNPLKLDVRAGAAKQVVPLTAKVEKE